jgi:hypothetical protein
MLPCRDGAKISGNSLECCYRTERPRQENAPDCHRVEGGARPRGFSTRATIRTVIRSSRRFVAPNDPVCQKLLGFLLNCES